MLKVDCINPKIIAALAGLGHGDKILISDGNYPLVTKTGDAEKIFLGLAKDLPKATDVLTVLMGIVNFEQAEVMTPEEGDEPAIFEEFRNILGMDVKKIGRYEFYDKAITEVKLAINTGESRLFANVMLTIGCA